MKVLMRRVSLLAVFFSVLGAVALLKAQTTEISASPSSVSFANTYVGKASGSTVITINRSSSLTLNTITLSPLSFSTSVVTVPATILAGGQLAFSVFYTPSQVTSETGALDLTYKEIPDDGVSLSGTGVAPTALDVATAATLPQATKSSAYQATLSAIGGTAPYTWSLTAGAQLPLGLTLFSAGGISGTLDPSVATSTNPFTVQVMDSLGVTNTSKLAISVFNGLG